MSDIPPLDLLPVPSSQGLQKSIDIDVGWPASLVGGERPSGISLGAEGPESDERY